MTSSDESILSMMGAWPAPTEPAKPRSVQRVVGMPRWKWLITSKYGKHIRGTETDDLRGAWAAAEYELSNGATEIRIIVQTLRHPNAELTHGANNP